MRTLPLLFLFVLSSSLRLLAQDPAGAESPADPARAGQDALIERRYADAVTELESALQSAPVDRHDELLLLLGRAHQLVGDLPAAIAAWERLVVDHPQSEWRDKAALQRAAALATIGDGRRAAAEYRKEVARLTGTGRKEEIAATYLGLADAALAEEPPAHARAIAFYDLALDLGLSTAKTAEVRLLAAEAALAARDFAGAAARFEPLTTELDAGSGRLRAMFGSGRSLAGKGEGPQARDRFADLLAMNPDAAMAAEVRAAIVDTFAVPRPSGNVLQRALRALDELAAEHPDHPKARIADYLAGESLLHCLRSADGLERLRRFLVQHGDEGLDEVPRARARIGDVLSSQGRLDEAIAAWREYLAAHPAHGDWERVQGAIVDAEFRAAERARAREEFKDATRRYGEFMRDHPLDARNPAILLTLADMARGRGELEQAASLYRRCASKYPQREQSSAAQYRLGRLYEDQLFDYQRAVDAYGAVRGQFAGQAQQRLSVLRSPGLSLQSPRTFRSGEAAHFTLTSRNIPEVRVRVWRLDLETWFRATHTPSAASQLDIEIIEPDRTFTKPVDEYVRYRQTEQEVPIGFDAAGAYIVKVDDEELESTSMVLVTDLALTVESSRHELLAFAQDLTRDEPATDVRVLVSDGERIVAEGETGADGVWRWRDESLAELAELRVFAVDARGSGAGTLQLGALQWSAGLTPRALVFTDRPAYRPGEAIGFKGFVREVDAGVYRLPQGSYRLRVVTPRGRWLVDREVALDDFGSVAMDWQLPADAEPGTWRVALAAADPVLAAAGSYPEQQFTVADLNLPKLAAEFVLDQPLVFRGERITGQIMVRHFYGAPAVGRAVRWSLVRSDGGVIPFSGTTGEDGAVRFDFASDDFGEEGFAVLKAELAEQGLRIETVVPVVTTALEVGVGTLRDVYLTDESFEAEVRLRDRRGEAASGTVTVELLRQVRQPNGAVAEVSVRETEVVVRASDDGVATVTLQATEGGVHLVRVAATDRRGQIVTGERRLMISGQDDAVKLRLLTDVERAEVGESVTYKIVSRAERTLLALHTELADGVLHHEVVRIPAGESEQTLELRGRHAPNFALQLTAVDGQDLRTARREFAVSRALQLEVEVPDEPLRPGADWTLRVTSRAADGTPVPAELAVALVDEAVLQTYPDRTPSLQSFFHGVWRQTQVATTSSAGWKMASGSQPVRQELREEQRRVDERAEGAIRYAAAEELTRVMDEAQLFRASSSGVNQNSIQVQTELQAGHVFSLNAYGQPTNGVQGLQLDSSLGFVPDSRIPAAQSMGRGSFDVFSVGSAGGGIALPRLAVPSTALEVEGLALGMEQFTVARPLGLPSKALWIARLRTGADGRGELKLQAPDHASGFAVVARGGTAASEFGDATAVLRTAEEVMASVSAPAALLEGDRVTVRGRVHDRAAGGGNYAVEWSVGDSTDAAQDAELAAGAEQQFQREVAAEAAGELSIGLTARGPRNVAASARIPVRARGIEHRVGAAGVVSERDRATLRLPETSAERPWLSPALRVEIGGDSTRRLVAMALGEGLRSSHCVALDGTAEAIALRGLAALHVLERLRTADGAARADVLRLEAAADAARSTLLGLQLDGGGMPWRNGRKADLRSTVAAVRLFAALRRAGRDPAGAGAADLGKAGRRAVDRLSAELQSRGDALRQAAALRALAEAGQVRFEQLNALHRRRASLAAPALGELALAWHAAGRKGRVAELAGLLAAMSVPEVGAANAMDAYTVALGARVLQLAGDARQQAALTARIDWLQRTRSGSGWGAMRADEAAVAVLAAASPLGLAAAGRAELRVDGKVALAIEDLAAVRSGQSIVLSGDDLASADEHVVEVVVEGRGEVAWSATLQAFRSGYADSDRQRRLARVDRKYLPALMRIDGKAIQPGFRCVTGDVKRFTERADTVAVGSSLRVEASFAVPERGLEPNQPLVFVEPIPAGCTVPKESIQGGFDHVEVLADRLLIYYSAGRRIDIVRYELVGRFEGQFTAPPAELFGAGRPDRVARSGASELRVLPRGAASPRVPRMTPDELLAAGTAAHAAGDLERAGSLLGELVSGRWELGATHAKTVAQMMLDVALAAADSQSVVRWFEVLKETAPDLVIPFGDILKIGDAYAALGEFESAVLVFRATAEASFLKEAAVATALRKQGEWAASTRFLEGLLRTYPDLNTIRQSLYGLGQSLGARAMELPATGGGEAEDPQVGSRQLLQRQALAALRRFLVLYPDDPLAAEVTFSWATTAIEAEDLTLAQDIAERALERFESSPLRDELLYTVGFTRFASGDADRALEALREVATAEFPKAGGGRAPSENRDHAIYLEAQVHDARGEVAEALADYDRVESSFADAAAAGAWFRRRALELPEVTALTPGEDGQIKLSHRNLDEVDLTVHRVDLMRLYLLQRSLEAVRAVRLHGITPHHEQRVDLPGEDFADYEREIELPVDEAGAYLVVARSAESTATGLVLRTGLELAVQEDPAVGRVRVHVLRDGEPARGVHVKVIDSGGDTLRSGDTDLRGVWAVGDLVGEVTVLVREGDEFAFHRGDRVHQPARMPRRMEELEQLQHAEDPAGGEGKEFEAWGNNFRLNGSNRARQIDWLNRNVLDNDQRGVQVLKTR